MLKESLEIAAENKELAGGGVDHLAPGGAEEGLAKEP
jgi:hypothetical protein